MRNLRMMTTFMLIVFSNLSLAGTGKDLSHLIESIGGILNLECGTLRDNVKAVFRIELSNTKEIFLVKGNYLNKKNFESKNFSIFQAQVTPRNQDADEYLLEEVGSKEKFLMLDFSYSPRVQVDISYGTNEGTPMDLEGCLIQ